jgi:nucleolin
VFRAYVGNISFDLEETGDLEKFFTDVCGCDVATVELCTERNTGEFRGFGFVNFKTKGDLDIAIAASGARFLGRPLRIDEARPKPKPEGRYENEGKRHQASSRR